MVTRDIRCRIDAKVKAQVAQVLEAMGLSVSDAVRLFLERIAADGAIPFDFRIPNAKTTAAMKEVENLIKRKNRRNKT